MAEIACRLICHSAGRHIQQVYTGLAMLQRAGQIELTQDLVRRPAGHDGAQQHLTDAAASHARVVLNESVTAYFDMHDSRDIDVRDLDGCDVYFKRSFDATYVRALARGADKVHPFGLNYHVLPDFIDWLGVRRAWRFSAGPSDRLRMVREALDATNRFKFYPRVRDLESFADRTLAPRVLFLATAYDPYDRADRPAEKAEERRHNNETRAQCIRLLRKALGSTFLGGFDHSAYALANYPDCLAADRGVTGKARYLQAVKSHPICVATRGLHGSIGWKFAEYLACARAIVTQPLTYSVVGGLAEDRNYLVFDDPLECVDQVTRLVEDRGRRDEMMAANAQYYRDHLRPDALMLDALRTALSDRLQGSQGLPGPHTGALARGWPGPAQPASR